VRRVRPHLGYSTLNPGFECNRLISSNDSGDMYAAGVKCYRSGNWRMETVIILFFCCAVMFLWYIRSRGDQQPLSKGLRRGVAMSKYVVALMAATFGAGAVAALIAMPLLLYARLAHTPTPTNLFAALLDRPYFPLQTGVAFVAGLVVTKWLKEGKPAFIWALPTAQFLLALAVVSSRRNAFQGLWDFIRSNFFNWDCHCSASLLQWQVMFPLYTSIAFAVAAYLREVNKSGNTVPSRTHDQIA
jgi:hypothetical protein